MIGPKQRPLRARILITNANLRKDRCVNGKFGGLDGELTQVTL